MIRDVHITTIAPAKMRYRTVGDWYFVQDGVLEITVADTGYWVWNILVAIHELIEAVLCTFRGIDQKQVDEFDLAHAQDDDPGSNPAAPYHDQHVTAMGIEMLLSVSLGAPWRTYEQALAKTYRKTPRSKRLS